MMIGADLVGGVIGMFQQQGASDQRRLMAECHFVGEMTQRQSRVKLPAALIDA